MRSSLAVAVLAFSSFACQAPTPTLPDGEGRGLLSSDTTAPAGAAVYERPTWRVGDRFTMVVGERVRSTFTVTAVEGQGYVLDCDGKVRMHYDLDLGNLGMWVGDGDVAQRLLSPVDVRYTWPLWVGKTWSCEFAERTVGGPAVTLAARYRVEAIDRVSVPAGTFEALRIVRLLRPTAGADATPTRAQVIWYAPSVGFEVRQMIGQSLIELDSFAAG